MAIELGSFSENGRLYRGAVGMVVLSQKSLRLRTAIRSTSIGTACMQLFSMARRIFLRRRDGGEVFLLKGLQSIQKVIDFYMGNAAILFRKLNALGALKKT